jgi:hypothetical protein
MVFSREKKYMAHISTNTTSELLAKRDQKTIPHLEQYAPVWIVDQKVLLEEEAVQFNVVFLHPHADPQGKASWVNRRYRYDGFNDTLYHKGQRLLDEDDAVDIMEDDPYVDATVSDTPNSYGG